MFCFQKRINILNYNKTQWGSPTKSSEWARFYPCPYCSASSSSSIQFIAQYYVQCKPFCYFPTKPPTDIPVPTHHRHLNFIAALTCRFNVTTAWHPLPELLGWLKTGFNIRLYIFRTITVCYLACAPCNVADFHNQNHLYLSWGNT